MQLSCEQFNRSPICTLVFLGSQPDSLLLTNTDINSPVNPQHSYFLPSVQSVCAIYLIALFSLHLTLSVLLNSFHMKYVWKLIYSVLDSKYKEAPILCIIQILFIKSATYTNNQKKDNFPILWTAQLSPQLYIPVSVFNFPGTHCLWSSESFPNFASLSDVNLFTYPQPCVKYRIQFALSNGLCLAWLSLCFFSHIFVFT